MMAHDFLPFSRETAGYLSAEMAILISLSDDEETKLNCTTAMR